MLVLRSVLLVLAVLHTHCSQDDHTRSTIKRAYSLAATVLQQCTDMTPTDSLLLLFTGQLLPGLGASNALSTSKSRTGKYCIHELDQSNIHHSIHSGRMVLLLTELSSQHHTLAHVLHQTVFSNATQCLHIFCSAQVCCRSLSAQATSCTH
jgi:hypothetical protein